MISIVFLLDKLSIGGTECQFFEFLRHLDRRRFAPAVIVFKKNGILQKQIEALQIPVTCVDFSGISGKFNPKSLLQLFRLIQTLVHYFRQQSCSIVQSFLFWPNIYGSLAAKIAKVPVRITGRRNMNQLSRWHYRWLQDFSNHWATAIVTNAIAIKEECLQRERWLNEEKIHVLYNGVNCSYYQRALEYQDASRLCVGIVAMLHPRKGHQDFLHAAALVLQQYPQTLLRILGRDAGSFAALKTLAESLHISDDLLFCGESSNIPKELAQLDILVSSSYIEGLSNAILEGMAAGKAIVATRVGGTPELITHEKTGLLVPPGDPEALAAAIIRLLANPTERQALAREGQKHVERHFSITKSVRQAECFYEEQLRRSQRKDDLTI